MILFDYEARHKLLIVSFIGKVDARQAEEAYSQFQSMTPAAGGFQVLTDFTDLKEMDLEVREPIKKSMDFLNSKGVTRIIRVVPEPEKDFGFNILSMFHYSKRVQVTTVKSRAEAEERLKSYDLS